MKFRDWACQKMQFYLPESNTSNEVLAGHVRNSVWFSDGVQQLGNME